MKTNCTFEKKIFLFLAASISGLSGVKAQVTSLTFSYTGSVQTFTVPACVGTMTIDVRAAQGSAGGSSGPAGANGAAVRGVITATPGQVMYLYVGGQGSITAGGFNGGGNGGVSPASSGGGGGGGSDIRIGGSALSNRIMAAGAGGGGGGSTSFGATAGIGGGGSSCTTPYGVGGGAAGGCAAGTAGGCSGGAATGYGTGGGGGGTGSGAPTAGSSSGTYGTAGVAGIGGNGGSYTGATYCNGGGGGGGGYYGGAGGMSGSGGCNGGGGGGSSYADNTLFSSITFTSGVQTGNGVITMTYALNGTGVSVVPSSSYICSGSNATLTGSGVVSYTWLPVGSFVGSNASNIIDNPTTTTNYTVFGTNSIGCVSNTIITINVNASVPSLTVVNTATASSGICPGKTATLTASGALTYSWTNGVINGVSFAPTTTQTYVLTGGNACGTSSAVTSISIHPLPIVSAVASTASLCSGNSCTLTGVGNATSYAWFSNPVVPSLADGVGIFPSSTAVYTVIATSALSCTNSAQTTITVVNTPALAPVLSPQLICIGGSSTITATGATNYVWTPGAFGNLATIIVSPTISTTYTLTKSNANCVDVKVFSITVNPLPTVFAISSPTIVCANGTATLSGGGANTYTWTNANPTFSLIGAIVAVSPSATTVYSVAASNGTCSNTNTVLVSTNPNPTITIGATSTVICQNDPTTLTLGGGVNYTWSPSTITGTNVVVTPTLSTLYTVTGDNVFNCTSSTSQIIIVNPIPPINAITNRTLVCVGGSATLTAFGANTYQWSTSANTTVTVVNPLVTTIYSVTGFYTATNCQNTKTISVSVFSPSFSALGSNSVCIGGAITLSASGASTYTWNVNPPSPFPSIVVSPSVPTVYVVSATSFSNGVGCISSQSKSISIYMNPTITATPERTLICKGETTNLLGGGGAVYEWSTSQTGSVVPVNPTALTFYTVTGTDANGCVGTATTQLKVSNCVGLSNYKIASTQLEIYPNPNNGEFTIHAPSDIKLSLMNELGEVIKVFTLNENNDYKVSVKTIANGIYFIVGQHGDLKVNQKIVVTN